MEELKKECIEHYNSPNPFFFIPCVGIYIFELEEYLSEYWMNIGRGNIYHYNSLEYWNIRREGFNYILRREFGEDLQEIYSILPTLLG